MLLPLLHINLPIIITVTQLVTAKAKLRSCGAVDITPGMLVHKLHSLMPVLLQLEHGGTALSMNCMQKLRRLLLLKPQHAALHATAGLKLLLPVLRFLAYGRWSSCYCRCCCGVYMLMRTRKPKLNCIMLSLR